MGFQYRSFQIEIRGLPRDFGESCKRLWASDRISAQWIRVVGIDTSLLSNLCIIISSSRVLEWRLTRLSTEEDAEHYCVGPS